MSGCLFDFCFANQMRLTLAVAILLSVFPNKDARGTTIVVARSPNEIVIGADSKVTDTFGNELNRRTCKILQVGNLFLAFEGLEIDRQTGFNVSESSLKALQLKRPAPAAEKVSILTGFLVARLFEELPQLKKLSPETYKKKIEGGQMFLRIVVATFERGRPLVFVRSFKAAQITAQQFAVTVVPDDCLDNCGGGIVTRYLGETAAIDGLPDETAGFWQQGLVAGVRKLIDTEIVARSEYVGPPIDIVRIDKRGVSWIQRKPECHRRANLKIAVKSSAPLRRDKTCS